MKKSFITGITGQDGSYLAELLLEKGHEVHGLIRPSSSFNTGRIQHIFQEIYEKERNLFLHYGDISDQSSLDKVLHLVEPDEVYNLAAQSHVRVSFDIPVYTVDSIALGTVRLLEAIKNIIPKKVIRFYQASSSEMYGGREDLAVPQNESTPFYPKSPYACAKVYAYYQTINYRESYGIHASNGILFNHESPRRGKTFVSRKITTGIAKILSGKAKKIYLGNLSAKRDWGHAKDYVEAMWLMCQQEVPDDYVIATGITKTVEEFVETAFSMVGLKWKNYVEIDKRYYRPSEVNILQGDSSKAEKQLGWRPKVKFKELVYQMLENDLKQYGVERELK